MALNYKSYKPHMPLELDRPTGRVLGISVSGAMITTRRDSAKVAGLSAMVYEMDYGWRADMAAFNVMGNLHTELRDAFEQAVTITSIFITPPNGDVLEWLHNGAIEEGSWVI